MEIPEFIAQQPPERQQLLSRIHEIIVEKDKTVTPTVGLMMGKEMILYHAPGTFKYALASVKSHMSLHLLPMYGSPVLYDRFKERLPLANFQKGCINFKDGEELPLQVVEQIFEDCAPIDLAAIREKYLQSKPTRQSGSGKGSKPKKQSRPKKGK